MKFSEADKDLAIAELCKRDLRHYVRRIWPEFEPGQQFIPGFHIDAMSDHLQALNNGDIRRLIINVPPRTCKSSISSVLFPSWVWLRNPATAFVTSSYEYSLAARDSLRTRRLMDSRFYQRLNRISETSLEPIFKLHDKGVRGLGRLKDTEAFWENNKGGYRIAVGVQGALTGKGGDILCVDDPQNPEQANSEVERMNVLRWWDLTMSTRTNNPKTARWLIVMQRLHCFDLVGHELEKNLGYVHLKLPMEYKAATRCVTSLGVEKDGTQKTWEDPRINEGELLWPTRFGTEEVETLKKKLGPWGFAAQEQQEPVPDGGGIVAASWFNFWEALPMQEIACISVDCAFTDAQNSSYVVIQGWLFKGPHAYLIEQVRQHLDFTKTEEAIHEMHALMTARNQRPSAILVENKANGPAVISRLIKRFPGVTPMEPRKMGGSKESRLSAVAPFVKSGNVFLPKDAGWLSEFLTEVSNFPKYKTDDQVDAMSQALFWRFLSDVDPGKYQRKSRFLNWARVKFKP